MSSSDDVDAPKNPAAPPGGARRPRVARAHRSRRFRLREAAKAGLLGHWLQSKPRDPGGARDKPQPAGPRDDGPDES